MIGKSRRPQAERAAEHVLHEFFDYLHTRRAVRTQWQKQDFFAAEQKAIDFLSHLEEPKMQVKFIPDGLHLNGVVSFVRWTNAELQEAIQGVFHESTRERIVEIVIEREGIRAVFEKRQ